MHGINIIINYLSFINWYVVNEGTFALGSIRNHKAKAIEKKSSKIAKRRKPPKHFIRTKTTYKTIKLVNFHILTIKTLISPIQLMVTGVYRVTCNNFITVFVNAIDLTVATSLYLPVFS